MPARADIHSILIIGSGPIVIGQACEFDYSGTQAVRALKRLGYRVILVNSNPATIMTDPELADATYLEPLTPEYLEMIIERERPDALLPTMGGQTALNLASQLHRSGVLEKHRVELIGARFEAIDTAEDRGRFQAAMSRIGLEVPRGDTATGLEDAERIAQEIAFPVIIRPAYTLGGIGGGVAYNIEEFRTLAHKGLTASPAGTIIIEESLLGWKEFELEVMRDRLDNVVIVCSIENFDPLGVHTGDSITVAPAQTLTDKEFQLMRDAAIEVMRTVGVDTGGSNIQFGIDPKTGRMVIIEMNPRVSRSSALASKATGFPIAKIAAQLAVGLTLGEIPNDITGRTVSAFEPTLDYVVVKIPRWAFEKFPTTDRSLTSHMKSVGEVMAIGRSFPEALQKAVRGLEINRYGLGADGMDALVTGNIEAHLRDEWRELILRKLRLPNPNRPFFLRYALELDIPVRTIASTTGIDPWFIEQLRRLSMLEQELVQAASNVAVTPATYSPVIPVKAGIQDISDNVSPVPGEAVSTAGSPLQLTLDNAVTPGELTADLKELLLEAKRLGFSDRQIAHLWGTTQESIRNLREQAEILPCYRTVDTCAAEFEALTPYYYSTYGEENEAEPLGDRTVVVLGSGPNRIGQGIEFDYCCVQAAQALKEAGFRVVMVNSNPETVSTDYDVADRLYFEPVTAEDIIGICRLECPLGVVLQFGGGTPLKLADELEAAGIPILGTSRTAIRLTEERGSFAELLRQHDIEHPAFGTAATLDGALEAASRIGYPVLVRPSFVLGGRAMEIIYDEERMHSFFLDAAQASGGEPVLIDRFIEDAFEFDLDAVADGDDCRICGIMQHIEEAGIHSGDSACVLPPYMLSDEVRAEMIRITRRLARELGIVGLLNLQFALRDDRLSVLELNPRASRTVPFVSKATGIPWARVASKLLVGERLAAMDLPDDPKPDHVSVKAVKFPFARFDRVSYFLGPEMRSTGEVMGIAASFGEAFAKAQAAVEAPLPERGGVFVSVNDRDKGRVVSIARELTRLGFQLWATSGTHRKLQMENIPSMPIYKVNEGRPNVVDQMKNDLIHLIVNTPLGKESHYDERAVGEEAYRLGIPNITTLSGASAAVQAIAEARRNKPGVRPLQDYYR